MAPEEEKRNEATASNEAAVVGNEGVQFQQENHIEQRIDTGADTFPVSDPRNLNDRVDTVTALLSVLPLGADQLYALSLVATGVGFLTALVGIASMLPAISGGPYAAALNWLLSLNIPYAGQAIGFVFLILLVGGYIVDTMYESKCPDCGTHLAMRERGSEEILYDGDDTERVKRHVECEREGCQYEEIHYHRREGNDSGISGSS